MYICVRSYTDTTIINILTLEDSCENWDPQTSGPFGKHVLIVATLTKRYDFNEEILEADNFIIKIGQPNATTRLATCLICKRSTTWLTDCMLTACCQSTGSMLLTKNKKISSWNWLTCFFLSRRRLLDWVALATTCLLLAATFRIVLLLKRMTEPAQRTVCCCCCCSNQIYHRGGEKLLSTHLLRMYWYVYLLR